MVLLGRRQLTLRIGLLFAAAILGGIAILWLWPSELVNRWFDTVFAL